MNLKFTLLATILATAATTLNADMIYEIPVTTIDAENTTLAAHQGKVMLIVNVASKCGFTGQYENLENLYQEYKDDEFVVLGFPCNQFGGQEPGTSDDIKAFCSLTYGVSFPMFEKIDVNGDDQHALYALLTDESAAFPGKIKWNFNKFLVSRDGTVIGRYGSMTNPESGKITKAIEAAL